MESFFLCTNCEKAKVFVHLFQKVVVSRGNAFGRLPQKAKGLYRQAYF